MAVAIIAMDFGLVRGAYQADARSPCMSNLTVPALIFIPPLSLLAAAAVSVGLGIARRGWASPFATGYLLLGGLASLGVCLDLATGYHVFDYMTEIVEGVFDPSRAPGAPEVRMTSASESVFDGWVGLLLFLAICWLPQITFAVIGGMFASRHGLTIVSRGRVVDFGRYDATSGELSATVDDRPR
jgi:hypothetical protein